MKNFKKYLLPLAVVILIAGIFLFIKLSTHSSPPNLPPESNYATIRINNGQSLDISEYVGKTALEATQSKYDVAANGTGVNAFVISIDGYEANAGKREFWEFSVNGKQAEVGAGSYTIQNHDQIEWKIANY